MPKQPATPQAEDIEQSLEAMGEVWPLAADVMRRLLARTKNDPDFPDQAEDNSKMRAECLEAWRSHKPFEEWPELLQNIVQEVAEKDRKETRGMNRRVALEKLFYVGSGALMTYLSHETLNATLGYQIAENAVGSAFAERLKFANDAIGKLPANPAAKALQDELDKLQNEYKTRSNGWRMSTMGMPLTVLTNFIDMLAGIVIGKGLSRGPADQGHATVPGDLVKMFQQAETYTAILKALAEVQPSAALEADDDSCMRDLRSELHPLATRFPEGARVLALLHNKARAEPELWQRSLQELQSGKRYAKLSQPLQHIIQQVALYCQERDYYSRHPVRKVIDRAGPLTWCGIMLGDELSRGAQHYVVLNREIVGRLKEFQIFSEQLKPQNWKQDKKFWDEVDKLITQEIQEYENLARKWDGNYIPISRAATTGSKMLLGHTISMAAEQCPNHRSVRRNIAEILQALEGYVHATQEMMGQGRPGRG